MGGSEADLGLKEVGEVAPVAVLHDEEDVGGRLDAFQQAHQVLVLQVAQLLRKKRYSLDNLVSIDRCQSSWEIEVGVFSFSN